MNKTFRVVETTGDLIDLMDVKMSFLLIIDGKPRGRFDVAGIEKGKHTICVIPNEDLFRMAVALCAPRNCLVTMEDENGNVTEFRVTDNERIEDDTQLN